MVKGCVQLGKTMWKQWIDNLWLSKFFGCSVIFFRVKTIYGQLHSCCKYFKIGVLKKVTNTLKIHWVDLKWGLGLFLRPLRPIFIKSFSEIPGKYCQVLK